MIMGFMGRRRQLKGLSSHSLRIMGSGTGEKKEEFDALTLEMMSVEIKGNKLRHWAELVSCQLGPTSGSLMELLYTLT